MVDLLLVRLTREDEKAKVIDLLMSELGMSREEAKKKVDNSPNVLIEGMEMEQGRIHQDRMYPFVDLLPRHYKAVSTDITKNVSEPAEIESKPAEIESEFEESPFELITEDFHPLEEEKEEEEFDTVKTGDVYYNQSALTDDYAENKAFDDPDDDSLIITSASEEMLTVERCHICGRTPAGEKKLAPCQTCGELTCSDCYNRKYHVCDKCVTEGRAVDRPLDSVPETIRNIQEAESPVQAMKISSKRKYGHQKTRNHSRILPLTIIMIVLVLVAAFVIVDPMNLLSSPPTEDLSEYTDVNGVDSSAVVPDTTLVLEVDTTFTPVDSLLADSTLAIRYISLTDISVPDSLVIADEYSLPRTLTSSSVRGIEILTDSLPFVADLLGQLAFVYSIEFDGISLIRTDDGFDILLMSILHPEPAEKRAALLGSLGTMLDSTVIDQMVLYYRENQYYEATLFSFTADSFSVLARSISPNFLQRKQAVIPETTELITGRVLEWMTDLD